MNICNTWTKSKFSFVSEKRIYTVFSTRVWQSHCHRVQWAACTQIMDRQYRMGIAESHLPGGHWCTWAVLSPVCVPRDCGEWQGSQKAGIPTPPTGVLCKQGKPHNSGVDGGAGIELSKTQYRKVFRKLYPYFNNLKSLLLWFIFCITSTTSWRCSSLIFH